jgi:hypothetical protein
MAATVMLLLHLKSFCARDRESTRNIHAAQCSWYQIVYASTLRIPAFCPLAGVHFFVRSTCNLTSLSIFFNQLSAKTRSVNRSADLLARCLMARVSSGDSVSALWNPSAYSSAVVAWKPVFVELTRQDDSVLKRLTGRLSVDINDDVNLRTSRVVGDRN